jgi:predicted enzyme related to lactoylglutathione lyase
MENMIVWADIPVTDLARAMKFYSAVLRHEFVTVEGMPGVGLPAPDQPATATARKAPCPSPSTW